METIIAYKHETLKMYYIIKISSTSNKYNNCSINLIKREPGSSVSIVSGYGLDDRAIEVRSPAEAKGIFL
jgi:hypothetical protein